MAGERGTMGAYGGGFPGFGQSEGPESASPYATATAAAAGVISEAERAAQERAAAYQLEAQRNAEAERRFYEQQVGALRGLERGAIERFAAARAPQEAAVAALGQRAGTLEGGAALQGVQQARERAQAQAMVAARTPYGGKGASPEAAILGGAIGAAPAAQFGALEQEAAARQAAYLRGVQQLGAGLMTEAEQRRLTEQEMMRDMQARFLAAQQIAAANQERRAAQEQQRLGAFGTAIGTVLGGFVGGPAGAAAGGKMGGSISGGKQ